MNRPLAHRTAFSACPHDCPSTCALEVEVVDAAHDRARATAPRTTTTRRASSAPRSRATPSGSTIPNRLLHPLRRKGKKGDGRAGSGSAGTRRSTSSPRSSSRPRRSTARRRSGPISTPARWASCSATASIGCATPRRYSGQFDTICTNPAWTGYIAGTGRLAGPDPREMAKSDLVVIWGTNAVATQVNVMTHAVRARKERGAQDRRRSTSIATRR